MATSAATPVDGTSARVSGLDGIRGLAAVFVVVNHVFLRAFPGYPRDTAPFWAGWFVYGRFAVVVFIVLSGFSLAVAPARSGWQVGGVGRFARRRARRILPPYYAALALSLAVAWLVAPPPGQGAPTTRSLVVNSLLVQNLVYDTPKPNRAFWSIAVEVQLYVVFPLLLLLVRKVSAIAMLAAVTVVVTAIGIAAPHFAHLNRLALESPPDLAVLFAVGILAAGIVAADQRRRAWPWHWLALAAALPVFVTVARRGSVWTLDNLFWVDLSLGPAIGCLLAGIATARPGWLVRALHTRPLRSLGSFSYSLYLTHAPIVVVVYEKVVARHVRQGVPAFLVLLVVAVPAALGFAWLFATVFEFPFRPDRGWGALPGAGGDLVGGAVDTRH